MGPGENPMGPGENPKGPGENPMGPGENPMGPGNCETTANLSHLVYRCGKCLWFPKM
jgi:hypothetical protein